MADLKTKYLGLDLKNPVVVSSSNLTASVDKIEECEKAGAGAVVLKSLFEEQIKADTDSMMENAEDAQYAEAFDYLTRSGNYHYIDKYLTLLEEAKSKVSIPVIASINCVSPGSWIDYAKRLEKLGADALELNVFILPSGIRRPGAEIEQIYIELCRQIRKKVSIPFALKIGTHFSGLAHMIKNLKDEGASGFVLFNRFYQPDVDIEQMDIVPGKIMSAPQEMALSLRWIALLSGEIEADFAAATGIHDGKSIIKQLLVGAKAVQLCTVLYQNGIDYISAMLNVVTEWMERHDFSSLEDFRGKLSREQSANPEVFERAQYVKALVGIS